LFELFEKEIRRAVKEGLLEIRPSRREGRREFVGTVVGHKRANEGRERDFFLSLTEKGIDFSNRVFLEFMLPPG
jgi:DNA-binding MarR family transcriptional regulator